MITSLTKQLTKSLVIALMATSASAWAQNFGAVKFPSTVHDFGTFKEEKGPQKHRFAFTNSGKGVLKIDKVQAGCGCTTPDWTKEEIKPGQTGFVDAEYNPAGRPGKFDKYLTVFAKLGKTADGKDKDSTLTLNIKGSVIEREKTPADLYPDKKGPFRLASSSLYMDKITPGSTNVVSKTFKIYNDSDTIRHLSQINTSALPHLKITIDPVVLKPKETASIKVDFDPSNKKDYGFSNDAVKLFMTDGKTGYDLYVAATLEDTPKKLTPEEAAKAPKLTFDKKEHDFGIINDHQEVSHLFTFTNKGKENLIIKKTKANCGCTASEPAKKVLAPGESSNIKVSFNSTGKHEGDNQQMVTIYSSDPQEPTQYITIKAKVDKKAPALPGVLSAPTNMMKVETPKK
jgi:hypothetical protein